MLLRRILLSLLCLPFVAPVAVAGDAKWQPYVDFGGKIGNDRMIGEANLFAPLVQTDDTLFFADLRTRFDNLDDKEGNFGLGVRHMLDSGWNIGGYTFYDRRSTTNGSVFNQATFGAEALSLDWDLRANVYQPFGSKSNVISSVGGPAGATANLVGTAIVISIPGLTQVSERAVPGFDAEVGWRVPVFEPSDTMQLRAYIGGYHFDDSLSQAVEGPRARLQLTLDEVPQLWAGARVDIGAEIQHDDPRGTQSYATLRLRIPLQDPAVETTTRTLTAMERRMLDPIVRDIDIVAGSNTTSTPDVTENAIETAEGSPLTILDDIGTTGAALPGAVAGAGDDSTVILVGDFDITAPIDLQEGQTLMGFGLLEVRGGSDVPALVVLPGATIFGDDSIITHTIGMNDNSTLAGMVILQEAGVTMSAIDVTDADGAVIYLNVIGIEGFGAADPSSIEITNSSDVYVGLNQMLTISDSDAYGITSTASDRLTIEDNLLLTGAPLTGIGISISNSTGTEIVYNDIQTSTDTISYGIAASSNTDLLIDDNIIDAISDGDAITLALLSNTVTVSNNDLYADATGVALVMGGTLVTFNSAGSVGNINSGGGCNMTASTGSISFIDNTTCP